MLGKGTQSFTALKRPDEESWRRDDSGPDRFLTISFANARFDNEAVFSDRTFDANADFTNSRFYYPPDFDAVTKASRIDFTGAHIGFVPPGKWHWTKDGLIPVRLRAFRKIAQETKNHDLERNLYIEERKAERGVYLHQQFEELKKAPAELNKKLEDITNQKKHVWLEWRLQRRARNAHWFGTAGIYARLFTHLLWIGVMWVYWAFADYGRTFARPFVLVVLSVPCFYWGYANVLAPLMREAGQANAEKYEHAVGMLAYGNAVPFVGPLTIDSEIKKFLFCPSGPCSGPINPPEGYQLLVLSQNLLSITLVFFIGLALRNFFKIK